ncbi:hypothetical protein DBR17_00315 [Sphingomonas sp. HMWF008]|nr:hypothetical protein DBR17_00315 [Sphingomonas sp. HMWF008]
MASRTSEQAVRKSGEMGSSSRLAPQQARSQETRSRILKAARKAFAEVGFVGANLREIAQDADTTHAMIRYHFGTKDELWREAVREMFEALSVVIDGARQQAKDLGLDLRERYRCVTLAHARYCAQHPEHARITIMESISGSERFDWMVKEFVTPAHTTGKYEFDELVAHGVLPAINFASYVYAYVGMLQLPFVLAREAKVAMDFDFLDPASVDGHAEAIFNVWVSDRGRSIAD